MTCSPIVSVALLSSLVARAGLLVAGTGSPVAGCLYDRDKDNRLRINCTARGFSDVPAGIESMTQVLVFPENVFSSLCWSSFQIFPGLHEVDLTRNKVPEVPGSPAAVLPSLSVLRLGWNQLRGLAAGCFSACPALTELHLPHNTIANLSDGSFSGLSRLEILDMTANRIAMLPAFMLHPLVAIEMLYLEKNQIQVLPDDWFSQKEAVPFLFFSDNPWTCSCSLGYLYQYLDDNQLNFYVRNGDTLKVEPESLICDSPLRLKGVSVLNLEETDLCEQRLTSSGDFHLVQTIHPHYNSRIPTTIAPYQNTIPLHQTTIPPHQTTIPPHQTTIPPHQTTIPPHQTTIPLHQTTIPPHQTTIPLHQTTIPLHQTTIPLHQTTIPLHQTTIPPHQTTIPPHQTTATIKTPTTRPVPPLPTSPPLTSSESSAGLQVDSTVNWVIEGAQGQCLGMGGTVGGVKMVGGFCIWLLAGGVLLCVAALATGSVIAARLVTWYQTAYRPLAAGPRGGRETSRVGVLLPLVGKNEHGGRGGEVYRSVLFVHKNAGGYEEEQGGRFRETLYRVRSRGEEVRVYGVEGGVLDAPLTERGGATEGGVAIKRYSVILREEMGVAGGRGERDWVVGGWEVKGGGGLNEEVRSSWGEWLTEYLPSMPWVVTTPVVAGAEQSHDH